MVECPLSVLNDFQIYVEELKCLWTLFTNKGKVEQENDRLIGTASAMMQAVMDS